LVEETFALDGISRMVAGSYPAGMRGRHNHEQLQSPFAVDLFLWFAALGEEGAWRLTCFAAPAASD